MFYYPSYWAVLWLGCSWASINESRYIMALSRKHFEQFADFMVDLWSRNKNLKRRLMIEIDLINEGYNNIITNEMKEKIAENIESRLTEYYNNTGKEIQLLLDKNGLRFNKYRFKNYILARCEKNDTKIELINSNQRNKMQVHI